MVQISDNMRGAALMAGSMAAFTVNDGFMKAVLVDMPLFQAMLLRGIGITIGLVILCSLLGQLRFDFPRRDWGLVVLRTSAEMISTWFFLTAISKMPLANLSAVLQALPLTVTLAGAVVFREALGWRRLTAILVGFAGVLLIIQPGAEGFTTASFYALGAVAFVTVRDLAVRRLSRDVPSVMVALVAGIGVTSFAGVGAVFVDWVPLTMQASSLLAGAMVCLIGGYVFSVQAMRTGEISFIAPFRYTSLLVALLIGVLAFGETPDHWMMVGAAVVVATGLFTLYREARIKRAQTPLVGRLR